MIGTGGNTPTRKMAKYLKISENLFLNSSYILECLSIFTNPWSMTYTLSYSIHYVFTLTLKFRKYRSYLCWLVKFEHNFHLNFNLSFNLSESFLFSNISTKISDVRHITDNKRMQWTLLRNKFSVIEKNSLDNLSSRPWRHYWRVSLKAWLTSSDLSDERITHLPSILFTLLKN